MKKLTIWQNIEFEEAGAIFNWAKCMGVDVEIVHAYKGAKLKLSENLLILGGPVSVYDNIDFVEYEKEVLINHIENDGKVFGICLGAQLLASALGSTVYKGEHREAGWRSVDFINHKILKNFPDSAMVFHWHSDTFELPKNTELLASNDAYQNQAFCSSNKRLFGIQFHLESTQDSVGSILHNDGVFLSSSSPFVSSAHQIEADSTNITAANKLMFDMLDIWSEA